MEKDAGNAAAKQILTRAISEEEWEAVVEYLIEEFPKKYHDMDGDELDRLNKSTASELVLKTLMPNVEYMNRPQLLAIKWNERNQSKKRPLDTGVVNIQRRQREERQLQTYDPKLRGCTRLTRKTGISIENQQTSIMADESLAGYSISIPNDDYMSLSQQNLLNIIVELQENTIPARVYARIQAPHNHTGMIHASPAIMRALNNKTSVFVRLCASSGAKPLVAIKLRFYGTPEEFRSPDIVPHVFIDELLRMPLVSRGQIIMDVIRVQELRTTDGEEVFVAEIPSQREEREVSFEFEPETPSNIGCNLCSLPIGNEGHYCSAVCAQRASIMSCATCGHESQHVCSGCNAIGYCSAQCQHENWNQIHSEVCSIEAGVKRLSPSGDDDEDDDDNRNVRRRERGVVLPPQMDMRMNNVRFLRAYIEQHGLDYIRQHVWAPSGAEDSVEAALRENNLFWFLVRQYMQSREEFNPLVNYRDLLA